MPLLGAFFPAGSRSDATARHGGPSAPSLLFGGGRGFFRDRARQNQAAPACPVSRSGVRRPPPPAGADCSLRLA